MFWDVKPRRRVNTEVDCLTLEMKALCAFETSVTIWPFSVAGSLISRYCLYECTIPFRAGVKNKCSHITILLPLMYQTEFFFILKYFHGPKVLRDGQNVNNSQSLQCTDIHTTGLISHTILPLINACSRPYNVREWFLLQQTERHR